MRIQWLLAALLLTGALLGLHWWAMEDFLYWQLQWFDVPMHFLGGLSLGVLAVGFLHTYKPRLFIAGLLAAFIAWELFELAFGLPREDAYILDTCVDIVMDTLGAVLAYAIARKTIWRK
jgi:VanZ family protein